MRKTILIQKANGVNKDCLHSLLQEQIHREKFNVARIAAAYVTVSGVRKLLDIFDKHGLKKSFWLIGLDDAISQPGVFDTLKKLDNVEIRVASFEKENARFHPKFFSFECDSHITKQLSLIGSVNLTRNALMKNAEATSVIELKRQDIKTDINDAWLKIWSMGHKPTGPELAEYKKRYEKSKFFRKKIREIAVRGKSKKASKINEILVNDDAEIDPSLAATCWIECGKITGGGTQLEIKSEQALFFHLSPSKEVHKTLKFKVSNGNIVDLNFDLRENDMWRLQFKKAVPEVEKGLRKKDEFGNLLRSRYVAVFQRGRGSNEYQLSFIENNGGKFDKLKKKTKASGTLGRTSARQYGWC